MAVIIFFKTSGIDSQNSSEATDYLLGSHSALTQSLKRQYELQTSGIKFAKEVGDFELAELLKIERNEIQGKLREPPPVSLSMNTKNVEYAISVTQHKRKYASGVIAHAKEDTTHLNAMPAIEVEYRELFESLVFAGLPSYQWLIEWVQHTHEENIENHFIIPRINLSTGKYFNPHYPGSEHDFNAVRDYLNLKHSLASPYETRRRSSLIRINKYDPNKKLKQKLLSEIRLLIASDIVQKRLDVIFWLKSEKAKNQFNIENIDVKPEFIRLKFKKSNGKNKLIKLKGALFRQDFTDVGKLNITNTIEAKLNEKEREKELAELLVKVNQAILKRAKFNKKRYEINNADVLLTNKRISQNGERNNESNREEIIRSDNEAGSANGEFNSTIAGSRAGISTTNRRTTRRPSFVSKLIEKFTAGIKRFISKRRKKRNRVERQVQTIDYWLNEQQRINDELYDTYENFAEQINRTSLNKEKRRIRMKINVLLFDYNKNKPKNRDFEYGVEEYMVNVK